jgi:aspartate racemase
VEPAGGGVIGVIGGLGPEATVYYYRGIIREYRSRTGASPRLAVYSVPIEYMCRAARAGDTRAMASLLLEGVRGLARLGAGYGVIAANTPHAAWDLVEPEASRLGLRLIHIARPSAERLEALGARRVGILATRATLDAGFYQAELEGRGITLVAPEEPLQETLDKAIERLASGGASSESAVRSVVEAARSLEEKGVDALLVACTDISPYTGVLAARIGVPIVDSSVEHVRAVVEASLGAR